VSNSAKQERVVMIHTIAHELRQAVRRLSMDRGFTVAALCLLGLGIGVNNMMFTVIYGHTLRKLPIHDPDRVLYVSILDGRGADRPLSYPEFVDLRSAKGFAGFVAYSGGPVTLSDSDGTPERVEAAYVTPNAFEMIGRVPAAGRMFTPAEDTPGAPRAVLVERKLADARYGGAESALGRSILVNGAPATVIGIFRERSGFPSTASLWMPLSHLPGLATDRRDIRNLRVFGRMRDEATVADATAEATSILQRSARDERLRVRVVPLSQRFLGRATEPVWLAFMAAGFLVLIVSCANVANLLLARAVWRTREIAIRTSLGASRPRLVGQLLIESTVLAALGGVVGLGVSLAGIRLFRSGIPDGILPYWLNYDMDAQVFGALLIVSFATVLVFGMVPALKGSKTDVNQALKQGGCGRTVAATRRWATTFVVAEFALTVVLLAHAVANRQHARPPVETDAVVTTRGVFAASVALPPERYRSAEQKTEFYARLVAELRKLPQVASVSIASTVPLRGAAEQRILIAGQTLPPGTQPPAIRLVTVDRRYFSTLGLGLERGEDFPPTVAGADFRPAIVSHRFAAMFFRDREVLGVRIRMAASTAPDTDPQWLTIIAVAPDIRYRPMPEAEPVVYVPLEVNPPASASVLVRTRGEEATAAALRAATAAADPQLPLHRVMTMAEVAHEAEWNGRLSARFLTTLTLIGVGLVVAGLYAVTAHAIGQRRREIAIRMALGARAGHIGRAVLARACWQVALGLLAGIVCTMIWDAVLFSGRVNLRFAQPDVLVPVAVMLTIVMLVACAVPVLRASRLDPGSVLRAE
jgi:predicted permease